MGKNRFANIQNQWGMQSNKCCIKKVFHTRSLMIRPATWDIRTNGRLCQKYGDPKGRPYFFIWRKKTSNSGWIKLFPTFKGKYGVTNVWNHPPLHNEERLRIQGSGKYAHLNQKQIKLIELIIEVSSNPGDVIWEPFGGLCTAGLVSCLMSRIAYCTEIDEHT